MLLQISIQKICVIAILFLPCQTTVVSVDKEPPRNRFRGLVPSIPLPESEADTTLTDEERHQRNLLGVYGPPGAAQQQVAPVDATPGRLTTNQVQAGLNGKDVPLRSRPATQREVQELLQGRVVFLGGDDDNYAEDSPEAKFLEWERQRKKAKKREA